MAERSEISWTDATFNWWEGCTKAGPGCDNCYAETRNARFGGGVAINWGPGAPRRLTSENNRNNLERWNCWPFAECKACGWRGEARKADPGATCPNCKGSISLARRRVFISSLSDVFDNEARDQWRADLFAKAEACTELDLYVLTKRIGNVKRMVPARWLKPGGWPKHIRLGITIVTQKEADRDIEKLLALDCPNFVSMEPLLEAVDLTRYSDWLGSSIGGMWCPDCPERGVGIDPEEHRHCLGEVEEVAPYHGIDWVIVGGESGPGARPMHPQWVRDLRDQCIAADVPFHFKQWGEWIPADQSHAASIANGRAPIREFRMLDGHRMHLVGKKHTGRLLDGAEHNEFPA